MKQFYSCLVLFLCLSAFTPTLAITPSSSLSLAETIETPPENLNQQSKIAFGIALFSVSCFLLLYVGSIFYPLGIISSLVGIVWNAIFLFKKRTNKYRKLKNRAIWGLLLSSLFTGFLLTIALLWLKNH